MPLLRFFFWVVLFYLIYKIIRQWLRKLFYPAEPQSQVQVKGKSKPKAPLDLSRRDVEDAEYEEIKQKDRS